ncbi:biotin/lipoyl-containing protein [Thermobispora bispora]|uniref:Biotin/lipoyl attachment domain-containing protein n=1 Tax=Thermobispora bispora (strain ATCC 19993 / DSM 43833 / CBS 139.67 / JCM 10125 / KCTC 9307 / NBRC 14880 / R51) TaxID=469371 RepID=D6YBA4_THEBD|nr:lipoyl domain-containing protein [Thermobispora bispora]ADG88464.1 biotin/lipoyl attachment domain-containing protein [Thermobispora bispora DSM 43833]
MTDVPFPVISENDPRAEGVVSTWFASDGQPVREGDLIAEVAVDKVDVEVPAPASGVIRLLVEEGTVVRQGDVIARIE